jgi:hypothetical protein
MIRFRRSFIRLEDRITPAIHEFIDPDPGPGETFGNLVVPLATGNVVVTDPWDSVNGYRAGAVYLFNGKTGALISTLRGSSPEDQIGTFVTALPNGNFVVKSQFWHNGPLGNAGALTFGNGVTGVSGVVNASNSLIGSQSNDQVGDGGVYPLSNGNYVVISTAWRNGTTANAGAITLCDGSAGTVGVVSPANSLVGTSPNDISYGNVTEVGGGNFVIVNSEWDNPGEVDNGAVTFMNGLTGLVGPISGSNSLIGATGDKVGSGGIIRLMSGDFVVHSPNWDGNSATYSQRGAVTLVSGTAGLTGLVSPANSYVGARSLDSGLSMVRALANGNFVLAEPQAANDLTTNVVLNSGAVTLFDGSSGGIIGRTFGTKQGDSIGLGGIYPLTNGNYVFCSYRWDNGGKADVGAATWASGTAAPPLVDPSTSLIGGNASDGVGSWATALSNGNYVIGSRYWKNSSLVSVGTATWGNGQTGTIGVVTAANSLTGSTLNDEISSNGIYPLTDGNYVVCSERYNNGAIVDAGAVTWGNGTVGTVGLVSPFNSLVGTTTNDRISIFGRVVPLPEGRYLVRSDWWDNGPIVNASALTFGQAGGGTCGPITSTNSLIGMGRDGIGGGGIQVSPSGAYLIATQGWKRTPDEVTGVVTFGPPTGVVGTIATSNSATGTAQYHSAQSFIDVVNQQIYAAFRSDGGGRVHVGSLATGFAAPRVANVVINDGAAQRSNVTKLTVEFDQRVELLTPPGTLAQLVNQKTGDSITLSGTVTTTDVTRVSFTFSGTGTSFGSLRDGRHTLTIPASGVRRGTLALDGDGNGSGGDNYVLVGSPANGLFRLFGDADGSGQVGSSDFLAFRLAFLSSNSAFDSDGDGQVGSSDFLAFRLNFLATV